MTTLSPGMQCTVCGRVNPVARDQLVALDHLLDPRPPWVIGDVDDVDARGAKAGHDQMRAVRPVAGRAAAVPAEVVQLVAHVGHRRLMHDAAVLGVDHSEEVRPLDAGALVQACEIKEILGRGAARLLR